MKIAVTYEDGKVFQHFGHTENFKVYEVEDNKITSAEVVSSNGSGHEALAGVLDAQGIDVLICGGCGAGAAAALEAAGIVVVSGAEGDTDDAVAKYLAGELVSAGVNCDHHDHHDHDDEGGCTHNCGSCGGCGGAPQPIIEGPNAGKIVKVHYIGTLNDGTKFDSSYDRDEPLEFICGVGMMIAGFDKACVDMKVGEVKDVQIAPAEAYGEKNPDAVVTLEIAQLPGSENLNPGERVVLTNAWGQPVQALVVAKDDTNITFDTNHELAGKILNFKIEMVEVQ